jgi:hypothetical protein
LGIARLPCVISLAAAVEQQYNLAS